MSTPHVHCIDLNFQGNDLKIFSFIVETDEGPVIIETGPHSCHKVLCEGLENLGYKKEDVKHVFLTHIHLDHAGGAWCFAELGAKIYVHPLGFKNLHDPTKLLASAERIYGSMMDKLWGTLKAIPEAQFHIADDYEVVTIGNIQFRSIHTPGHAKHHSCWQLDNVLFTGDLAGIKHDEGPVIPPCPPPDINIELWLENIDKVLAIKEVDTYYVTHGAKVENVKEHMELLKDGLRSFANFVKPYHEKSLSPGEVISDFIPFVSERFRSEGMSEESLQSFVQGGALLADLAGLLRYWKKKEEST